MAEPTEWGGEPEILAACEVLQAAITVRDLRGDRTQQYDYGLQHVRNMHLVLQRQHEHYHPLVPAAEQPWMHASRRTAASQASACPPLAAAARVPVSFVPGPAARPATGLAPAPPTVSGQVTPVKRVRIHSPAAPRAEPALNNLQLDLAMN